MVYFLQHPARWQVSAPSLTSHNPQRLTLASGLPPCFQQIRTSWSHSGDFASRSAPRPSGSCSSVSFLYAFERGRHGLLDILRRPRTLHRHLSRVLVPPSGAVPWPAAGQDLEVLGYLDYIEGKAAPVLQGVA